MALKSGRVSESCGLFFFPKVSICSVGTHGKEDGLRSGCDDDIESFEKGLGSALTSDPFDILTNDFQSLASIGCSSSSLQLTDGREQLAGVLEKLTEKHVRLMKGQKLANAAMSFAAKSCQTLPKAKRAADDLKETAQLLDKTTSEICFVLKFKTTQENAMLTSHIVEAKVAATHELAMRVLGDVEMVRAICNLKDVDLKSNVDYVPPAPFTKLADGSVNV